MENQNENIIAAIDVGTTKIVVLVGRRDTEGHIEVIGYGRTESKGMRRGAVLNIDEATNSIRAAVQQAEEQSGFKITNAYVGIAGQHIRSQRFTQTKNRNSANERISQADVDSLINQMREVPTEMGEEVLHILPQSYTVDGEHDISNPVGMDGKQLSGDFHIVFGQMAAANNLRQCVENNGIKVKSLILEPLASSEAVLTNDDKELGVVLVDIGGGTTDVAIFRNGQIYHTEVIPFGGNVITSDIKESCSILERQAESLKVQFGQAIVTPDLANKSVTIPGTGGLKPKEISLVMLSKVIQARMNEIIATVKLQIDNAGLPKNFGAGIVLTGGGAMLRHVVNLFSLNTGLEVRIGVPNKIIKTDIESVTNLPSNSTSIGLLMMGFKNSTGSFGTHIQQNHQPTDEHTTVQETENTQNPELEQPENNKKQKTEVVKGWLNKMMDFVTTVDDTEL